MFFYNVQPICRFTGAHHISKSGFFFRYGHTQYEHPKDWSRRKDIWQVSVQKALNKYHTIIIKNSAKTRACLVHHDLTRGRSSLANERILLFTV